MPSETSAAGAGIPSGAGGLGMLLDRRVEEPHLLVPGPIRADDPA
ncbi:MULTISPECIES: hypothetical protein [Microbacterium]|nr:MULTISPECIES: hypothetical protein [Microbacterium]|tara:strand:+ start:767 stop:901 length:135 start_codon:yes stop_codon:yes gene_type:complete